jgi:hypothetical protein
VNSTQVVRDQISAITRLRHAERRTDDPGVRADMAEARRLLEQVVGPTVRQATAARLLGVTQAALLPWIERGEIASVLTPQGRREIPLSEIVDLFDDIAAAKSAGRARPLAAVIRERRKSAGSIDVDHLLPPREPRGHRVAELQSLAYHRLVARRLDEVMLADVRSRLETWRSNQTIHPHWLGEWERVLSLPAAEIAEQISDDSPAASELRQTSPFAGLLSEHERRHLQREVAARVR